jgi:hypothetical protein
MPYLCDIRSSSANNVIEVGGKLFIEGVEFTPTNLAPIAFSQGPTFWAAAGASTASGVGVQAVGQLCLPRTYVRATAGIFPANGTGGQFDSTKISCGQDIESTSFVYSAAQGLYYGVSGYNITGTLSSFDNNFRVIAAGVVNTTAAISASATMPGYLFLPSQNSRWITMNAASVFVRLTSAAAIWGTLTEAGVWTGVGSMLRYPSMPYIGTDWVMVAGTPYDMASPLDTQSSVSAYILNRNTGAQTTLATTWIPSATPPAIESSYTNLALCYPSNAIVETPGSSFYFYYPSLSTTGLNVWIGSVSNLASTPTIGASSTAYTITSPAGVDTVNEWVTTSADVPNFSRVRFTTSSALPAPLALATNYWTIRLTASTSRIATSYANAVAGTYIDLTTTGVGTQTMTAYQTLNLDTSAVVGVATPLTTSRNVRAWTFVDGATNYLCVGVYEPGVSSTVPTTAINLYLWRLDSKTTATFLQKLELGTAGRVRSFMPIDSTQKRLAVVYDDKITFYAWNSSTNWTFQSNQSLQTQDVGVDSQGRVWATDIGSYSPGIPTGYLSQSLYVYEPSGAAVNITVSFAQSAYTYTGATIASSIVVNAYDTAGARVALSVTLTRDTTNFDFAGSPSTVITTSTSIDTIVPISVFGTGLLSVLAVPT